MGIGFLEAMISTNPGEYVERVDRGLEGPADKVT